MCTPRDARNTDCWCHCVLDSLNGSTDFLVPIEEGSVLREFGRPSGVSSPHHIHTVSFGASSQDAPGSCI